MIRHGKAPFLECSSRGDKRFSAFYAVVDGETIEKQYQAFKVFRVINNRFITDLSPRDAKEQDKNLVNWLEAKVFYSQLWDRYIKEHPAYLSVLRKASGLSDMFGQVGHCCQATELWRIRNTGQPYRIVATDNFDRSGEQPGCDERFMFGPMPWEEAELIVRTLNRRLDNGSLVFYKVEPVGYQLQKFEP